MNTVMMVGKKIWVLIFLTVSVFTHADLAVVVANTNGTGPLTREQVSRIFLAKLNTFPDGTTAVPLDNIPQKSEFYRLTTGKSSAQLHAYWARLVFTSGGQPPKELENDDKVIQVVSTNPNTVGYIDKTHVTSAVKVLLTLP